MKIKLKNLLLISLFFSIIAPNSMQASLWDWVPSKGAIQSSLQFLDKNIDKFFIFSKEHPVIMGGLVTLCLLKPILNILKKQKIKKLHQYFQKALELNDKEKVEELLQQISVNEQAAFINKRFNYRSSNNALTTVAATGNLEIAQLLLEKGANVDGENLFNVTALMEASFHGHLDMVKLLKAAGASLHRKNKGGWDAYRYAAYTGQEEVMQYFIDNNYGDGNAQITRDIKLYFPKIAAGYEDSARRVQDMRTVLNIYYY